MASPTDTLFDELTALTREDTSATVRVMGPVGGMLIATLRAFTRATEDDPVPRCSLEAGANPALELYLQRRGTLLERHIDVSTNAFGLTDLTQKTVTITFAAPAQQAPKEDPAEIIKATIQPIVPGVNVHVDAPLAGFCQVTLSAGTTGRGGVYNRNPLDWPTPELEAYIKQRAAGPPARTVEERVAPTCAPAYRVASCQPPEMLRTVVVRFSQRL